MKKLSSTIILFLLFGTYCSAQDLRAEKGQHLLITEDGMKEIISYKLTFSPSTLPSANGSLKIYFTEIRSHLMDKGMNVSMKMADNGEGHIFFETATPTTKNLVNTWLSPLEVEAKELHVLTSKNWNHE